MTKLNRETVIRAALELLDEVGVDGLTTRRLAERLQVRQPALYWHFKNKRALLDALAEAMLAGEHRARPRPGESWRTFLVENARSFRRALLSHRDGARIHAGTRPTAAQADAGEAQIRFLCGEGFSVADAAYALMTIGHFTVGSALEQQAAQADAKDRAAPEAAPASAPFMSAVMRTIDEAGPDAVFEHGLALIVDGVAQRLG